MEPSPPRFGAVLKGFRNAGSDVAGIAALTPAIRHAAVSKPCPIQTTIVGNPWTPFGWFAKDIKTYRKI